MKSDVGDAKTIVDVISATLNSAGKVQGFSETGVLNNVRKLNEMLGIKAQYPQEVEKRRLEELRKIAYGELKELKDKEEEIKSALEKVKRKKSEKSAEIKELDNRIMRMLEL